MLIGGLGLDYYSAPSVVIFAEAMPTFNVMSGTFYWLPLRLGLKLGL